LHQLRKLLFGGRGSAALIEIGRVADRSVVLLLYPAQEFFARGQTPSIGRGKPAAGAVQHASHRLDAPATEPSQARAIRDEAQLEPGMPLSIVFRDGRVEIEPAAREVRLAKKGRMRVAVPVEKGSPLCNETVRATTASVRNRR